jgi:pyruvate,water dikinase
VTATAFEQWNDSAEQAQGLPAELRTSLLAAYAELGNLCGVSEPSVAVRSSSVIEDGSLFSFAGQYETVLNVIGGERLVEAVISCWASARSERVLAYMSRNQLSVSARMAVLVQELVAGDVATVVFSMNPVTGNATDDRSSPWRRNCRG